ncbi:MAG: hypothetical protein QOH85_90 [Acidobacteriaceae bacterium]|nr:hypothetical protein [Acidobacteriaceae bacterium]
MDRALRGAVLQGVARDAIQLAEDAARHAESRRVGAEEELVALLVRSGDDQRLLFNQHQRLVPNGGGRVRWPDWLTAAERQTLH